MVIDFLLQVDLVVGFLLQADVVEVRAERQLKQDMS